MAAKPPKPPDTNSSNRKTRMVRSESEQSAAEESLQRQTSSTDNRSECSCTNISIRQLFYEMKQIFPTVPDDVVNQCVIENCHDPENCIKVLNNELAAHPTPAQSYPSQSIRGCSTVGPNTGGGGVVGASAGDGVGNPVNSVTPSRRPAVPARPAPKPTTQNSGDFQSFPKTLKSTVNHLKQELGNKLASVIGNSYNSNNNTNSTDMQPPAVNTDTLKKPNVPQRPTTLNLPDSVRTPRTLNRPTRTAPPPPSPHTSVLTAQHHSHQQNDPVATANQSFSSSGSASVQSPMSFSDSSESEISVNISLSPSSTDRSRGGLSGSSATPTRCITTISVQPEPAYTRAIAGANPAMMSTPPTSVTPTTHRSFTSLNLTLRKPSDTPQSPIDITAGSVLKYSSTRYDAINGCEQNFHITVTDGGGSITSARVRPRSCHYDPEVSGNAPGEQQQCTLRTGISMPNVASQNAPVFADVNYRTDGGGIATSPAQDEIIRRQQARKTKLLNEVKNRRQQLEEMNKEVNILQTPISPNVCDRLDREIEILRLDCERICQEINSRNGNTGVSFERVIENMYNGQPSAIPPQQRPPPIPPALSRFRSRPSPHTNSSTLPEQSNLAAGQNSFIRSQSYPLQSGAMPPNHGTVNTGLYDQTDYTNANYVDDYGPPWTCSMCTFQNYPLLNKCEGCDNVRIIPGTVQIVPSSSASALNINDSRVPASHPTTTVAAASNFASNPNALPLMQPVISTHNAPLIANYVVNNNNNNNSMNLSNHNHFPYRPVTVISSNNNAIGANNNPGPSPNMHQIVAYPAVMNPNFVVPQ